MENLTFQEEQNFISLINSVDEANVILALQIIKNIPLSLSIEEELLVLAKTHPNTEVRATVKKILIEKGKPELQSLYKDIILFVRIGEDLKEKEIRDRMAKMVQRVDWKEMSYFCTLLFKRFGKGLSHLLTYPENNPYRVNAISLLTENDVLDFHKGIGYQDRRNLSDEEKIIYWQEKLRISFPKDHPEPLIVKSIILHNCKIHTLSADIKIFENLEELDLSCNYLKVLPSALNKLTRLREIDASFNYFDKFPNTLLKVKNLKKLNLRGNDRWRSSLEIPEDFYKNNPECEVLLNK